MFKRKISFYPLARQDTKVEAALGKLIPKYAISLAKAN